MKAHDSLLGKHSKEEIAIVDKKEIYKKQTQISQIIQKNTQLHFACQNDCISHL